MLRGFNTADYFTVEDGAFPASLKGTLFDLGVKAPGGWSAGKKLVEAAIGGAGEVVFGQKELRGIPFPTLDVFYDVPAALTCKITGYLDGQASLASYAYEDIVFYETSTIPEPSKEAVLMAFASAGSLVSAIHRASLPVPMIVQKLLDGGLKKEEILWAWSTCPIPLMADDSQVMEKRVRASLEYGATASFWIRADEDDIIKAVQDSKICAQLCIHNLMTAKTHLFGTIDDEKLARAYFEPSNQEEGRYSW